MKERKDIDRLFQEKFKDFEQSPSPEVWSRIEQELNKDKKKRRIVPIWWRVGGVAAALLLFVSIGYNWFRTESDQPIVVDTPVTPPVDKKMHQETIKKLDPNEGNSIAETDENQSTLKHVDSEKGNIRSTSGNPKTSDSEKSLNGINQEAFQNISNKSRYGLATNRSAERTEAKIDEEIDNPTSIYTDIQKAGIHTTEHNRISANTESIERTIEKEKFSQSQTIEEAIAAAEALKEEVPVKEGPQQRWSITPVVAPVYSMALGEGSTIHSQFNQNSKSSDLTMSYGVGGSYTVTKRLKVRAGVNRVDFSNTTNDVMAFAAIDVASRPQLPGMGNITMRENTNVLLMSANVLNRNSSPEVLNVQPVGQLILDYGYLEVPLALEYRLIDRKFGVNLVGGFSTFFLNNNEISAEFNGQSSIIGEANNINSTSYSANFGVGLDYGISKQINVVLEPMFKYQINTFSNTFGDFQPFFIGVYTGLNFKF